MIGITSTAEDGSVRHSRRKPRVLIHTPTRTIPCLSVCHASETLARLFERPIPPTSVYARANWLKGVLADRKVRLSFPDSRRLDFPPCS